MKIRLSVLVTAAAAAVCALIQTACEVDSATGEVIVSPSSAALHKGDSIQFTASGGFEYKWRLKEEKWGMLSTRRGSSTVYTSLYDPRDCSTCDVDLDYQVVYADSYIPDGVTVSGDGGAPTNSMTVGVLGTGEAYITHLSECDTECEAEEEEAPGP